MLIGASMAITGIARQRGLARAVQAIFANGEPGLWLDFWDTTKTFQDSAGTIPVTGAGDLYGRVNDKSGRGNNATQGTTGAKPAAALNAAGKLVAVYDGFDDFMANAAIDFTATSKVTVFAAVRKLSDATQGVVVELGANYQLINGFSLINASQSASSGAVSPYANFIFGVHEGATQTGPDYAVWCTDNSYAAPYSAVIAASGDLGIADITAVNLSINGATPARATSTFTGASLTGTYSSAPLYIGMRGGSTQPAIIEISSLIVVGRLCTAAEKAAVLAYQASNMGLVL